MVINDSFFFFIGGLVCVYLFFYISVFVVFFIFNFGFLFFGVLVGGGVAGGF